MLGILLMLSVSAKDTAQHGGLHELVQAHGPALAPEPDVQAAARHAPEPDAQAAARHAPEPDVQAPEPDVQAAARHAPEPDAQEKEKWIRCFHTSAAGSLSTLGSPTKSSRQKKSL